VQQLGEGVPLLRGGGGGGEGIAYSTRAAAGGERDSLHTLSKEMGPRGGHGWEG